MSAPRGATRRRVVSLLPAATEIVAALGEADALVGISHECVLADALPPRPRVTTSTLVDSGSPEDVSAQVSAIAASGTPMFRLLAAEVEALHPDIIITQALCSVCAVSEADVRALATSLTPTPRIVSVSATTLDGVFADIAAVAAALDIQAESDRLLASLRARMKHVHTRLANARAPRPRVAVLEWTDPVFAAGHWVPEMIHRAGGIDVLAVSGQHSREMTWDSLTDAGPAIVLIAPCGYALDRSVTEGRRLVEREAWLSERTVWALDAVALVSQPGPRLVDGIETMAAILHPGLFDPPPSTRAMRLTDG